MQRLAGKSIEGKGMDYLGLGLLGTILSIGPRQWLRVIDSTSQMIAPGATKELRLAPGEIQPGSWTPPSENQAYVYENLSFQVIERDALGKLEVHDVSQAQVGGVAVPIVPGTLATLPLQFPPIYGFSFNWVATQPTILQTPIDPNANPNLTLPNGPTSWATVINTDSQAPHPYVRQVTAVYRVITLSGYPRGW